jgi:hypothetical protein
LKYFETIGSEGGLLALFVDNQIKQKSEILLLDLFIDGQVLIHGVVDLHIGLVAHIDSGSYRGSRNTPEKDSIQYMASMRKQYDGMTSSWH